VRPLPDADMMSPLTSPHSAPKAWLIDSSLAAGCVCCALARLQEPNKKIRRHRPPDFLSTLHLCRARERLGGLPMRARACSLPRAIHKRVLCIMAESRRSLHRIETRMHDRSLLFFWLGACAKTPSVRTRHSTHVARSQAGTEIRVTDSRGRPAKCPVCRHRPAKAKSSASPTRTN